MSAWLWVAVLLCLVGRNDAVAQSVPFSAATQGSLTFDRARLRDLARGDASPSAPAGFTAKFQSPLIRVLYNSDIPDGGNDGPMWAGRGWNASVTGGAVLSLARQVATFTLTVAPTVTFSENRPFAILRGADSTRSPFSSPWHVGFASADLPLRFGDQPIRRVDAGESEARVTVGPIAAGVSSTAEWWGSGIRNTLLLGNNAPGIPRGFLATSHPLRTRLGWIGAELFAGALTRSRFFDTVSVHAYRAISGARLTFRPAWDSALTLGLARLSQAPIARRGRFVAHSLDAITVWEPLAAPGDTSADGQPRQRDDHLFELFFRWAFPESGFETYGEWSRIELPRSLNEWFVAPFSTQGYILGLQWVGDPLWRNYRLRLQSEVLVLDQTQVFPDRPPPDYYTGRAAIEGWTNQGQVLGASTGPGSSAQFIAMDWIGDRAQIGAFIGRTRWENDALYRQPIPGPTQHDVTIYSGVRGSLVLPWFDASGELTVGRRINYLFQNDAVTPDQRHAVDVQNVTLSWVLSPR